MKMNYIIKNIDLILKLILFFVIFIFILEYLASMADARVTHVIDARGYWLSSKVPFFSTDFWLGMRPVGYPMIIKLLDSNSNLVIAAQSLFYLFSWSFFVIYIYSRAKNKLFGVVLGIGTLFVVIHPSISAWTHHVLTESLTMTFIAWIYILLHEFMTSKQKIYIYFLLGILVFYSTIRDVNAYYVLTFIPIFFVLFLYKYVSKINFIIASGILLMAFIFSDYTANHARNTITYPQMTFKSEGKIIAHRWMFPFMNIMGRVILNNQALFEYMKKEGMPVNNALLKQKNAWGGQGWYDNPDLQKVRDWIVKYGKSAYTKFLITHPNYTFGRIYLHRHHVFHYNMIEQKWHYQDYLPGYKSDNIFTYSQVGNKTIYKYLFLYIGIIVLFSFILKKNIFNRHTIPMLLLFLPIVLLAIVTYHGDGVDLWRHTIIIPFLIKITMIILIYVFGNELFRKIRNN